MNKSKAIIITRSSEYSTNADYNNAILCRESCIYNQQKNLLRFLSARNEWKYAIKKWNDNRTTYTTISNVAAYKKLFGKDFADDNPGKSSKEIPFFAIQKLMETTSCDPLSPYASFNTGYWEIILVLCDIIDILQKECVDPVDLFLESICKDLGITETEGDHVLYVHDKQVGLIGDGILVENHSLRGYRGENRVFQWATNNAKTFKRIVYFVHGTKENSFFRVNILDKGFLGENTITNYRGIDSLTIDDF